MALLMANTKSWTRSTAGSAPARWPLRPTLPFPAMVTETQLKAGEFNKVRGPVPSSPQPASAAQRPPRPAVLLWFCWFLASSWEQQLE